MDSPNTHNPALNIKMPEIEIIRNKFFPFFKTMILKYFQSIKRLTGMQNHFHAF